ncbi:winged helix-turn-helix transcriptional regulator [Novosphingobium lindaniclasticum]|nr:helix-turn-helix domain-containing protein [Novosphingobium lindaniclasticum]
MNNNHPVAQNNLYSQANNAIYQIGGKWTILIVAALSKRPHRFNELKRKVQGISQRMLTLRLQALQRDGLLDRTVIRTMPVRVEYSLTALGHSLAIPLNEIACWAEANSAVIELARSEFDGRNARS